MVFAYDDLLSSKQQRFDPYPSKKAPWVSGLEWDRCKNVAEMCVCPWIWRNSPHSNF
jgi:hypothetical protein